jgi:eukaryotic-like serine/threonine-protein kinase
MDVVSGCLLDNRYQIGRVLGRGGMATVYAATDNRLGRAVAVKLFHPPADEIALARLAAEACTLAGLSHPGLLKVFDYRADADRPYLVLQLIRGRTLRTEINRGPMSPEIVARLGARLSETLRYVHSRRVLHRDIKPSNVLLDADGVGYLADFGVAKAEGAAHLTSSGHCIGTAAYLSPEQVSGLEAGPAADVYSLGLVLLECLTGRPEFRGTEVEAALARLRRSPRVPGTIPLGLRRIVIAMTARDQRDRPSVAACARAFEKFLADPSDDQAEPATIITRPGDPPTRSLDVPVRRRWRPVRAAAALAVLAGLVGGVLLITSGGATPGGPTGDQTPAERQIAPVVEVVPETAGGQIEGTTTTTQQPPRPQGDNRGEKPEKPEKPKKKSGRG